MSSIVSPENTALSQSSMNPDGGMQVVGQQGAENFIEIKGDASVGIIGGNLVDTIITGAGDARVFAGDGDDIIMGGNGNDIFRGGNGNDLIKGGLGDDFLIGGAGDDTLRGGLGSDTLKGGTGDDVFEFAVQEFAGDSMDKIVDFKADGFADKIKIFGASDADVVYDATTGMITIGGKGAIEIGKDLDIGPGATNENGTWELF